MTARHEISGVFPANVHKLPCYRFYTCFTIFFLKTLYGIYTYHMYIYMICIYKGSHFKTSTYLVEVQERYILTQPDYSMAWDVFWRAFCNV